MGGSLEREVKLGAPIGFVVPDLSGVVEGLVAGPASHKDLDAVYYDTAGLRLIGAGITLRHRTTGGRGGKWTVKFPEDPASGDAAPDGSLARREVDHEGPGGRVPEAVAGLVADLTDGDPLVPVAHLQTCRRAVELTGPDGEVVGEVADDTVTVLVDGQVTATFREIEAEIAPTAPSALLDRLVATLRAAGAGPPDPTPKLVRALGAAVIVRASGGVVWRTGAAGGPEVLLVHRPKYDDWTIPKGKVDPGETDEEAAVREVEEETGLRCVPGAELAGTTYRDRKGRAKTVRYWAMTPVGGRFVATDEVDRVEWLPVAGAVARLTYGRDAAVLRSFADLDSE